VPAHHHDLVRTIIERLKTDDVTQDPRFTQALVALVADSTLPVDDRVARLERQLARLQANLIRSHAVGVGPRLDDAVVRLILALKAASLARGASGVRPEVITGLLPPGGSIVDFGAGTGRLAIPLARAGYRVTAVEPSSAMRKRPANPP
jgi:2-polyprenyl-3-methyl-5-hydroxy-6-metoxy-1,4-benzoquinol methylase